MLTAIMQRILFYRFENGKCPVEDYLESLTNKQVEKVFFVLDVIEQLEIIPKKFFKKLQSTDEIWEVRVQHGNNIFRLLGFLDDNDFVMLNHGFTKKSQKTPKKEIKIAEQRKKDYFHRRSII